MRYPAVFLSHGAPTLAIEDVNETLFVAMGAGGFPARRLDLGFDFGSLGMDGYVFGPQGR